MTRFSFRQPVSSELDALSSLQLRSKAHWGYDATFMSACEPVLTLHPSDLRTSDLIVALDGSTHAGVAQVGQHEKDAELMGLFVDPPYIGAGLGKELFHWAVAAARKISRGRLLIESDPQAAAFYRRMGAVDIGSAPSNVFPGRSLPLMAYDLR